jgi:uncharacterized protein YjeT (DUF2065 family)
MLWERFASMSDFLVALGLLFALEGLTFAAFPGAAKKAMASVMETPDSTLRIVGIVSAVLGVAVVWFVRG